MAESKEVQHPDLHSILDKLRQKATLTDQELKQLQTHIDELQRAAQPSHHHHDDSTRLV